MKLHTITDLKDNAGRIVDRALRGSPQYVVRRGGVVVIAPADLFAVEHRPDGFFADCYGDPDRAALEDKLAKSVVFKPETR